VASWSEVAESAPAFAEAVRGYLDAHLHKTLATVRRDGSPRISGIETAFADGELYFGAMWRSFKALDLRRDPRFALHSGSADPPAWTGDAKLSGLVEEITDQARVRAILKAVDREQPGPAHLFRADIREAAIIRLGDPPDHLVTELWRPGEGVRITRRT